MGSAPQLVGMQWGGFKVRKTNAFHYLSIEMWDNPCGLIQVSSSLQYRCDYLKHRCRTQGPLEIEEKYPVLLF